MSYRPVSIEDRREAALAFNEGVRAMLASDTERAVGFWRSAAQRDPTLVPALHNLIVYNEGSGRYEKVAELYAQLLAENPYSTEFLIRGAAALAKLGRYDEAIQHYRTAISIYPYFRFWYTELADILEQKGERDQASVWRQRAADLDADEAELAFDDGMDALQSRNYPLAEACFEAVLEDYPANLDARMKLARAQVGQQKYDEALGTYEEALTFTDSAQALVHLSRAAVYIQMGKADDAELELELAIDYNEAFGTAQRLAESLKEAPPAVVASDAAANSGLSFSYHGPGIAARHSASSPGPGSPAASSPGRRAPSASYAGSSAPTSRPSGARPAPPPPRKSSPTSRASASSPGQARTTGGYGSSSSPTSRSAPTSARSGATPGFRFTPPGPRYTWDQQLHAVFTQALAVRSPGGAEPCIALAVEPVQQVAAAMTHLVSGIQHPSYGLWRPQGPSRIFVAESNPMPGPHRVRNAGWMSRTNPIGTDTSRWGSGVVNLPIDPILETLIESGGDDGFNLVLILATGRVGGDDVSTAALIKRLRAHQVVFLRPQRHFADLGMRMQGIAPNWFEITLPF